MRTAFAIVVSGLALCVAGHTDAQLKAEPGKKDATVECEGKCSVTAVAFTQANTVPGSQDPGRGSVICTDKKMMPVALIQVRATPGGPYGRRDYVCPLQMNVVPISCLPFDAHSAPLERL